MNGVKGKVWFMCIHRTLLGAKYRLTQVTGPHGYKLSYRLLKPQLLQPLHNCRFFSMSGIILYFVLFSYLLRKPCVRLSSSLIRAVHAAFALSTLKGPKKKKRTVAQQKRSTSFRQTKTPLHAHVYVSIGKRVMGNTRWSALVFDSHRPKIFFIVSYSFQIPILLYLRSLRILRYRGIQGFSLY